MTHLLHRVCYKLLVQGPRSEGEKERLKLPNLEMATVSRTKLIAYLLSPSHLHGRQKAAFFNSFGFSSNAWQVLALALLKQADDHEVTTVEQTPFGMRYSIEGSIAAPDGRTPQVRVVWFVDNGEDAPRLVTAYPIRRRP